MANTDHTVSTEVKALLVRKGVDLSRATFGVTNGVVTVTGSLYTWETIIQDGVASVVEEVALARWLGRRLKRVKGVRDVIFRLDRVMSAPLGD